MSSPDSVTERSTPMVSTMVVTMSLVASSQFVVSVILEPSALWYVPTPPPSGYETLSVRA
ncbi:hypothetical protein [Streptomyces sp. AP-93]|uniref:hypothetical protein n=1 Tax=Streptomyces sp. AP-93 TaxID=2929048 RepID=UPI001FAFB5BD|nr:hypothetical protein [Streptomyces sp. AP-93]MCJ0869985.1 hypothetical protein [Streptomyces sp. AP-93]